MAFEVPDLPYDYAALEPHIDEATMKLHHDKHHQAYVDKANAALEGTGYEDKPVDELLANSHVAVGRAKRVIDASARPALATTLEMEASTQEYCVAVAREMAREAESA